MSTNTVSKAVATRSQTEQTIEYYKDDFAGVLPSHMDGNTFARLAVGALRKNADLRAAAEKNPGSLMNALMECARLGHEPATDQYALTYFMNNKTGVPEIVGIEQYQGEIERMYRAGAVASVKCEVVRENDRFRWNPTTMRLPVHEFDPLASEKDRGDLRGVYAFAEMHGGSLSQVVVMSRDEVMRHKAVAKSKKFWDGPWEPSMWKKTAIHELEKWVPTSAEFIREKLRAARDVAAEAPRPLIPSGPVPDPGQRPPVDVSDGEVIEGELVTDWPEPAKPGSGAVPEGGSS